MGIEKGFRRHLSNHWDGIIIAGFLPFAFLASCHDICWVSFLQENEMDLIGMLPSTTKINNDIKDTFDSRAHNSDWVAIVLFICHLFWGMLAVFHQARAWKMTNLAEVNNVSCNNLKILATN